MNSEKTKKLQDLLQSLISTSLILSNAEHQKREWLKISTPHVYQLDTIDDCYDQFTDKYLKMFKSTDMRIYLGDSTTDPLGKLYGALTIYADEKSEYGCCIDFGDVEDVLQDPKWHEIQRLAKEVHDALILINTK